MRISVNSIFLLLAALLPHAVHAADAAVATVNGQPVKQTWVDVVRQDIRDAGGKPDDQAILPLLVRNELLAQEAMRLGIDKRPGFAAHEEITHRELLANLLIKDTIRNNPISEDMLKAAYESFKTQEGNKEYSVRHIELKTEAEAREVIAQLAKGADFIKLAKEKSTDLSTRDNGGALGWLTMNAIVPPLGGAIAKLQKGKYTTEPIQSRAGWPVLKLRGIRDFQPPAYDKVKEQLRHRLRNQQIAKLLESLRSKAKIEAAK